MFHVKHCISFVIRDTKRKDQNLSLCHDFKNVSRETFFYLNESLPSFIQPKHSCPSFIRSTSTCLKSII
jgi:hypothetical protein